MLLTYCFFQENFIIGKYYIVISVIDKIISSKDVQAIDGYLEHGISLGLIK